MRRHLRRFRGGLCALHSPACASSRIRRAAPRRHIPESVSTSQKAASQSGSGPEARSLPWRTGEWRAEPEPRCLGHVPHETKQWELTRRRLLPELRIGDAGSAGRPGTLILKGITTAIDVVARTSSSSFVSRAGREAPVAMGPQDPGAGWAVDGGHLRASDADRELAIDALKTAFVQGRLSKNEMARRTGQALESRTYAELARATTGIPRGPAATPASRQPAAPVRARSVNWKVVAWVVSALVVLPGLAVAFFDTYYGSFYILLLFGFIASGLVGSPPAPGVGRRNV